MPINPSALGAAPAEESSQGEESKRKRRTKAELIAAAVVPGDNEQVDLKDSGTGAKIQRPWLVAVEMVREGNAEWVDKSMKYALMKFDQQKVAGAFSVDDVVGPSSVQEEASLRCLQLRWEKIQEAIDAAKPHEVEKVTALSTESELVRQQIVSAGGADPYDDESHPAPDTGSESGKKGDANVPPEAEVGDEVVIGSETYRVGHGRLLVQGMIAVSGSNELIHPKRRWQRELGTGVDGPWESTLLASPSDVSQNNGHGGEVKVQTEVQPPQIERVGEIEWKIGTGILQKIGLPDYSQLQVGPVNASRMVIDDGRRTEVQVGSRTAQIPTAVIEGFQEVTDAVEYVARYQRGELVSFLESVGALTQPVSS